MPIKIKSIFFVFTKFSEAAIRSGKSFEYFFFLSLHLVVILEIVGLKALC